jgi:hypothetical protein
MEAHNSHSKSFSCTVSCRHDRRDVPWPVARFVTFSTRLPPGYLPRISLNAKPTASKELNVISAASQINGDFTCKLLQDFFALRRDEMFFALERASALLLAPQA